MKLYRIIQLYIIKQTDVREYCERQMKRIFDITNFFKYNCV